MERLKQLKSLPWKIILPVAVLVITLALNIWLGCMPVFKGTYVNKKEGKINRITFYNDNFSFEQKDGDNFWLGYGFCYSTKEEIKLYKIWGGTYSLFPDGTTSQVSFKRSSVFSFYYEDTEYTGHSYRKIEVRYVCAEAVILQIVYIAIMLGCLIFLAHVWLQMPDNTKDEQCDESKGDGVQDEEGNRKYISNEEESE